MTKLDEMWTDADCKTCQTGHNAGVAHHKQATKRTWVGLTAEEAAECWTTSATQTWKNFETKLKEKNT